jgi:hypothetical protein
MEAHERQRYAPYQGPKRKFEKKEPDGWSGIWSKIQSWEQAQDFIVSQKHWENLQDPRLKWLADSLIVSLCGISCRASHF